jgi:hypothetical protein
MRSIMALNDTQHDIDPRVELIKHFFIAVILAVGLKGFVEGFLIDHLRKLDFFSNPHFMDLSYPQPDLFNLFFFLTTYLWAFLQFIFYSELIGKYSYKHWKKFFIDFILYSLMFVILSISFTAYEDSLFRWYISLIIVWHFFAYLWHEVNGAERSYKHKDPPRKYIKCHMKRMVVYAILFVSFLSLPNGVYEQLARHIVMIFVITAMVILNIERLNDFISKESREVVSTISKDVLSTFWPLKMPRHDALKNIVLRGV